MESLGQSLWAPLSVAFEGQENTLIARTLKSHLNSKGLSSTPSTSFQVLSSYLEWLKHDHTHESLLEALKQYSSVGSALLSIGEMVSSSKQLVRSTALKCLYYILVSRYHSRWEVSTLVQNFEGIHREKQWFKSVGTNNLFKAIVTDIYTLNVATQKRLEMLAAIALQQYANLANRGQEVTESDVVTLTELLLNSVPENLSTCVSSLGNLQVFGQQIQNPSLIAPLFGSIALMQDWGMKHVAARQLCTLFLRPESNLDLLLSVPCWQSMALPLFIGVPKHKEGRTTDQNQYLQHCMFLITLPHLHCIRTLSLSGRVFSQLLHSTCVQIAIYSGWSLEGVSFTSRLLEALVDSILNANHWRHDSQSPYWASIFELTDRIYSFALFSPETLPLTDSSLTQQDALESRALPEPTTSAIQAIRKSMKFGMHTRRSLSRHAESNSSVAAKQPLDFFWDTIEHTSTWETMNPGSILPGISSGVRASNIQTLKRVFDSVGSDKDAGLHLNGLGKPTDKKLLTRVIQLWRSCGIQIQDPSQSLTEPLGTSWFSPLAESKSRFHGRNDIQTTESFDSDTTCSSGSFVYDSAVHSIPYEQRQIRAKALSDALDFKTILELFSYLERDCIPHGEDVAFNQILSDVAQRTGARYKQHLLTLPSRLDGILRRTFNVKSVKNKLRASLDRQAKQTMPIMLTSQEDFPEQLFTSNSGGRYDEGPRRTLSQSRKSWSHPSPKGEDDVFESPVRVQVSQQANEASAKIEKVSVSAAKKTDCRLEGPPLRFTVDIPSNCLHAEVHSPRIRDQSQRKHFSLSKTASNKYETSSRNIWRKSVELGESLGRRMPTRRWKSSEESMDNRSEKPTSDLPPRYRKSISKASAEPQPRRRTHTQAKDQTSGLDHTPNSKHHHPHAPSSPRPKGYSGLRRQHLPFTSK